MIYTLFQLCEPVIKSDVEFARYILEPIALQVVIDGSQMGTVKVSLFVLYVFILIARVLDLHFKISCSIRLLELVMHFQNNVQFLSSGSC